MANSYKKDFIGEEDIAFDVNRSNEVFERETSTGQFIPITKVNAGHIPVTDELIWEDAETVQEMLVLAKAASDLVDSLVDQRIVLEDYLGAFDTPEQLISENPDPPIDSFAFVNSTGTFWHFDQLQSPAAWQEIYKGFPAGRDEIFPDTVQVLDWSESDVFDLGLLVQDVTLEFANIRQSQEITVSFTTTALFTVTLPISVIHLDGREVINSSFNSITIKATNGAALQEGRFHIDESPPRIIPELHSAENLVIDGQLNHWDEGTSFTDTSGYTATMTRIAAFDAAFPTFDQREFVKGQNAVPYNPTFYMEFNTGTIDPVDGVSLLFWPLLDVTKTSGETVTFSFWMMGSIGGSVGMRIQQTFGVGGDPNVNHSQLTPITTTWEEHIFTVTLNTVLGKSFGTGDSTVIPIIDRFLGSNQTNDYDLAPTYEGVVSITNVALVRGSVPFNGPWLTASQERERVNAFFWFDELGEYDGLTSNDSVGDVTQRRTMCPFPTAMHRVPGFTVESFEGYNIGEPVFISTFSQARSTSVAIGGSTTPKIGGPKADARL